MSCALFDIKAYLLGELDAAERARVEDHLASCAACREELERLRLTKTALLALRHEEIPKRIAFVSDPVLKRPWWRAWFAPGPRWGFASALVLALAIVVHGRLQPAPPAPPPSLDTAALEQRISAEVERRLQAALRNVAAEAEARQEARLRQTLAALREELEFQRKADLLAVEENFNVLKKRMNVLQIHLAANLEGGPR